MKRLNISQNNEINLRIGSERGSVQDNDPITIILENENEIKCEKKSDL